MVCSHKYNNVTLYHEPCPCMHCLNYTDEVKISLLFTKDFYERILYLIAKIGILRQYYLLDFLVIEQNIVLNLQYLLDYCFNIQKFYSAPT